MNVWVLTQGEYSSYGVVAVFSSEGAARKACGRMGANADCNVEEFPFYESGDDLPLYERWAIRAEVFTDGTVAGRDHGPNVGISKETQLGIDPRPESLDIYWSNPRSYYRERPLHRTVCITGVDREAVIKTFADGAAQWLAEIGCDARVPEVIEE